MSVLEVKNLKKYYGSVKAVDGISFGVNEGEIYGFLGPNGAGKTTTIRCLMDYLRPDEGEVLIFGRDARRESTDLKKEIGFLPSEVRLYDDWTGEEHLSFFKRTRELDGSDIKLTETLGLDTSKRFKDLSTGNKQKLGLVLALLHRPRLLILDEPSSGLDPLLQNEIHKILRQRAREGVTVFMSSHNLAEVERICQRVCIIRQGKIAAVESIKELKKKRVYTIFAYFDREVPAENELEGIDLEVKEKLVDGLVLLARGDIDPIVSLLEKYELKDLEITHANLEDVFLQYYR